MLFGLQLTNAIICHCPVVIACYSLLTSVVVVVVDTHNVNDNNTDVNNNNNNLQESFQAFLTLRLGQDFVTNLSKQKKDLNHFRREAVTVVDLEALKKFMVTVKNNNKWDQQQQPS